MPVGEDHIFPHDGGANLQDVQAGQSGTWCADGSLSCMA